MRLTKGLRCLQATVATVACVALVACGGGGGGVSDPPPAPTPTVTLFAGALQSPGSRDGVGAAAQFNAPADVAQDAAGNVYVADAGNHTIRKIDRDGNVSTLAGSAGLAGSADGTGANARFAGPRGVAVDAAGIVYVSDTGNATVRRIAPGGVVSTIAGTAGQPGNVDGNRSVARLNAPESIAVDGAGTLYVVDASAIRKLAADGSISTFKPKPDMFAAVAADAAGNVYVAASSFTFGGLGSTGTVRKFDSSGQALPFGSSADGIAGAFYPLDISVDAAGNVYLASNGVTQPSPSFVTLYRAIEHFSPDGMIRTTLAGSITTRSLEARTVDGPNAGARFIDPRALAIGPDGRIAVAETSTSAIRLVNLQSGLTSTLAGGTGGGDIDATGTSARFNTPRGLAAGADGTIYVADCRNLSVRKLAPSGAVTTLIRGLRFPENVAVAPSGDTVYEAESVVPSPVGRSFIAIAPDGSITGFGSLGADSTPALAVDAAGNGYGAAGDQVWLRAPTGTWRLLASGVNAQNLAVDAAGNVYFTSSQKTVGVIDSAGHVTIRAGMADQDGSLDGVGTAARFSQPNALALDRAGNMYVGDGTRVRKVTPAGSVTTIADITTVQGGQPGLVTTALGSISGLAWSDGALYASVLNALLRIAPVN